MNFNRASLFPRVLDTAHNQKPIKCVELSMLTRGQKICVYLCAITAYVAMALLYVDVESVLGTGPFMLATGIALIVTGKKNRSPVMLLGIAHTLLAILFVALVNILNWAPHHAEEPFLWMGRAYVIGWTLALYTLRRRERMTKIRWGDIAHVSSPVSAKE